MKKSCTNAFISSLISCGVLFSMQFGSRTGHSTDHALISLAETIKSSLEKGRFGCGIFIDLQKAFDAVNHEILLKKMEHYCIRGTALNLFTLYLDNRKQFVSVNGHSWYEYSSYECVNYYDDYFRYIIQHYRLQKPATWHDAFQFLSLMKG